MAVVDVHLSVHDIALLSEQVEISEHEEVTGRPIFKGDLARLDFAFLRVGYDLYRIVKARKPLAGIPHSMTDMGLISGNRASVQPPVDTSGWF